MTSFRFGRCFPGALLLLAAIPLGFAARSDIMPAPAKLEFQEGRLPLTESFPVAITAQDDARLEGAIARALARWEARTGLRLVHPTTREAQSATLRIACFTLGSAIPTLGDDESYTLDITTDHIALLAQTVVGAMRGLETLLQLLQQDGDGFFLPAVKIEDHPRFAWRGLMIDPVRHWQPVEVIKRNLDAMAVVKLNVLHLHLTDDQGFRVESKNFPEFTAKASDGNFYSQDDIRAIIAYATARGIRVMPEFDLPAHAAAWTTARPDVASAPGPHELLRIWGSNEVLDPTNEELYTLLDGFIGEMAALFPDAYLHIGGDENNGKQWTANAKIQAFIKAHGFKNNVALQTYFNQRLQKIVAQHGKHMIGWDEILEPGLPKDAVIHSWRGLKPLALVTAAQQGYTSILSNGYYIDLILPAAEHYLVDPLPADTPLTPAQQALVLGGEATMWSEWTPPETIDSRIWPRTAAIAERFWSPREVNDVPEMYRRLAIVSARLDEAGALHLKNYEPMLRRLLGGNPPAPALAALRTFVDAVEPMKHYTRGRNQKGVTQQTPLTGVVDCARPESDGAREFAGDVDRLLFRGREPDGALAVALNQQLQAWRDAADLVERELAPQTAQLKNVAPMAGNLVNAVDAGLEAVAAMQSNQIMTPEWRDAKFAVLAHAAQPNPAAIELPMLPSLRLLVAAANAQAQRATLAPDAWKKLVQDLAAPKKPAAK